MWTCIVWLLRWFERTSSEQSLSWSDMQRKRSIYKMRSSFDLKLMQREITCLLSLCLMWSCFGEIFNRLILRMQEKLRLEFRRYLMRILGNELKSRHFDWTTCSMGLMNISQFYLQRKVQVCLTVWFIQQFLSTRQGRCLCGKCIKMRGFRLNYSQMSKKHL